MSYFERVSETAFRATEHVGGAWAVDEQHIAPALGLLTHCVERDFRSRRQDTLIIGRLSFDIFGTVPIDVVDTAVEVLRPGRTIELVEARLLYHGRTIVLLRAWLLDTCDTEGISATPLACMRTPEQHDQWDPTSVWPGGYIASTDLRRNQIEPGRATYWVRTPQSLVADEQSSALADAAALFDIANGMTVRADPQSVAFPNLDLTVHLFAHPRTGWLGFDTTVSFGRNGIGLTHTVLHDEDGPVGTIAQILTVRPRGELPRTRK